jgi:putative oxidoreductase
MVNRTKVEAVAARVIRVILGSIFVVAGALKLMNPAAFAVVISHFRILTPLYPAYAALYLPWLEISSGLMLIMARALPGASLVLMVLCIVFLLGLGSASLRGLDIECGCFGNGIASSSIPIALFRTVVLGVAAMFVYKRSN